MYKIYFLILNYNTYDETIKCIRSIKTLRTENNFSIKILVVDNHSTDNSYEQLVLYQQNQASDYIILRRMESNVGFSKANNRAYQMIKEMEEGLKYIVICNSDIEFRQPLFLKILSEEYEKSKFHLCGPDVFCENDLDKGWRGHQSPGYPWESSKMYVKSQIYMSGIWIQKLNKKSIRKIEFIKYMFCKLLSLILKATMQTLYSGWRRKYRTNVALQGSCIILSERFIKGENEVFTPETNFYFEELLLYNRVKQKGYISVYNPKMKVYHMQGRATEKLSKENKINREFFVAENIQESAKKYLIEIEKEYK